jgi:hypothetical protein
MFYSFRAVVEGQKIILAENNPVEGRYEAIVILTLPVNTDANSPADQSAQKNSRPESQTENMKPLAGTQPARADSVPASNASSESPGSPASLAALIKESLSPLYTDKEKRDARRNSSVGDVYVDVNKDAYQRLMQGEQICLSFEEGGTYLSSPFILVETQSQLYLNFHQFNEGKQVSQDKEKILSQIFEIKGSLPNFVKACIPAQMIPKNNGYVIAKKGLLFL